MTDTRYRTFLWFYVALMAAAIVSVFFPTYSDALSITYDREPETWIMRNSWVAGSLLGALVVAWLVGLIGLFGFKTWARPLSLYSTLAGFLVYPFLGASLSSGIESALFEASATLWGAILALSYFSAVSDRFGR